MTWSGNKGLPPNTSYTTFGKVVRFKGYLYVVSKDSSTGRFGVYRTPPAAGNTPYSWSAALVTLAPGASSLGTTMNADGSHLYLGEYGDPQEGRRILRSADGPNWEVVFGPDSAVRHIHAVAPDPYHPGHVWATLGDGGGKAVMRSTDFGAPGSWHVVVLSSSGRRCRYPSHLSGYSSPETAATGSGCSTCSTFNRSGQPRTTTPPCRFRVDRQVTPSTATRSMEASTPRQACITHPPHKARLRAATRRGCSRCRRSAGSCSSSTSTPRGRRSSSPAAASGRALQLPVAALAVSDSDDVALAVSDSDDVALAEPVALTYTGRRG